MDGSGTAWEYTDSWAYKDSSGTVTFDSTNYWIFGGINCTDGTNTIYETQCPYPLCPLPKHLVVQTLLHQILTQVQHTTMEHVYIQDV